MKMVDEESYTRKLSSQEVKRGHIFILKDKLSFFPPMGKHFTLCVGDLENDVSLESYRCTCRGPQLPHDHHFIRCKRLRSGEKITITKDKNIPGKYHLSSKK